MAVKKELVVTALTAKLAGKNVSKKSVESYAARWADKIADEDGIEAFLDDRIDDVLDAQKEADRRANEASAAARKEAAKAAGGETQEEGKADDNPAPDDLAGMMRKILADNQKLTERLNTFESANQAKTLQERFAAHPDLKNAPAKLISRFVPKTEEEFEQAVADFKEVWQPVAEMQHQNGFGNDNPGVGRPVGVG